MSANSGRLVFRSTFFIFLALPALCQVRVWQDTLLLPTYEETDPDPRPPFSVFSPGDSQVYPYTMRTGFTKTRFNHGWRVLRLENEYLSCIVLPDLGGRLYSCKDKISGQEMFHANPSVKKGPVGLRGAWVAMGVELNFPVGHTWTAVSAVDFATVANPDGSGSVWVGDIDRVDGMQWRVEFILRPGSALLEQKVYFENRSGTRHRFYWWNNAGIARVDDKTQFIYPTHLVATHGRAEIDTWPVNSKAVDMSVVGNHKEGGVALFAYECREPFMAVYHPALRSGTVHYADARELPGKKVWSWGREGDKWAAAELSDNNVSYVEMQAGMFENQETYGFLEPGDSRKLAEYWMPIRGLGGVSRANLDGVLNLARGPETGGRIQLTVEFNANHKLQGARILVSDGTKSVFEERVELDPSHTFAKTVNGLAAAPRYTFQLLDGSGKVLISHTEDQYDALSPKDVKLGRQAASEPAQDNLTTVAEFLKLAEFNELQGHPVFARGDYQRALQRFPDDLELSRAMGRLAVIGNRFEEAVTLLGRVQGRLPNDAEVHYYLGIAHVGLGDDAKARKELESVSAQHPLHFAAMVALAGVLARSGDTAGALKLVEGVLAERPGALRAGEIEVALLRHMGRFDQARQRLAVFRALDPTNSALRHEQVLLGQDDPMLWPHLGADPERVLNLAISYMDLGFYDDAHALLNRRYPPPIDRLAAEPGAVLPQHDPLVGYYRAYCAMKLGRPARKDLDDASAYFTEYVFPSRASTFPVLRYALKENPSDPTALFLLGELYLASEQTEQAIDAWQQARKLGFRRPELYRDLGRALAELKKDPKSAASVYQEGLKIAPADAALQKAFEGVPGAVATEKPAAAEKPTPAPVVAAALAPVAAPVATSGNKPDLSSPRAAAAYALQQLVDGRVDEAASVFQAASFPGEIQDLSVREAYIEIQMQRIAALARGKHCADATTAEDHLGDEDPNLPFTFRGFGPILKGLGVQYTLAGIEATCGNVKNAKRTWSKLAKSAREVSDADFAIPFLAAIRAGTEADAKPRLEAALRQIQSALAGSSDRATLLYSRGLLQRALAHESDAQSSFQEALSSNPPLMIGYLAQRALREK